ncbi:hypothetical protein TrVE_jg185 [Triparma verrucosa]|uniref:NHL repeat-containing protein n=1 Tax=Triparma verrucosa TaxID=1606542 RepID=A0A9W7B5S7_9STRA|nr:hypothetical protein TrVE_jg185 [Triparma verrucosa]
MPTKREIPPPPPPAPSSSSAPLTLKHLKSLSPDIVKAPTGICVLPNGKLSFACPKKPIFLTADCKTTKQPNKLPKLSLPSSLCCDTSSFYVTDSETHKVTRLSLRTMKGTNQTGSLGSGPCQFQFPRGSCVIHNHLFVSDCNNHRVQRLSKTLLEHQITFGSIGSGAGELRYPHGLAGHETSGSDDPSRHRYELIVCDTQNHRLQFFNVDDGSYVRQVGEYGTGSLQFEEPKGVKSKHGYIFVAEKRRIQVLNGEFGSHQIIPVEGADVVLDSIDFGHGKEQKCYACDGQNSKIHVFGIENIPVKNPHSPPAKKANNKESAPAPSQPATPVIASVARTLHMGDILSYLYDLLGMSGFMRIASVCKIWNGVTSTKLAQLSQLKWVDKIEGFEYPTYLCFDKRGGEDSLVVSSTELIKYNTAAKSTDVMANSGNSAFNVKQPRGLSMNGDGMMYVCDSRNHRMQRWDMKKNRDEEDYVKNTRVATDPKGPLESPEGVVEWKGRIYVSDKGKCNVAVYDLELTRLEHFSSKGNGEGQLCDPGGLDVVEVEGEDRLYVADCSNHRVACFSLSGNFIVNLGKQGRQPGNFQLPSDVKGVRNFLVVSEQKRIQVLGFDGTPMQVLGIQGVGCLWGLTVRNEKEVWVGDGVARCIHQLECTKEIH